MSCLVDKYVRFVLCALFVGLMAFPVSAWAQNDAKNADDSNVATAAEELEYWFSDAAKEADGSDVATVVKTGDDWYIEAYPTHKKRKTAHDYFGEWRFSAELHLGAAPYDGDVISKHTLGGTAKGNNTVKGGDYKWYVAGMFKLAFGYMWGEKVLVGPELSAHTGAPFVVGLDLRIKGLVPITNQDAFTSAIGLGLGYKLNFGKGVEYYSYAEEGKNYPQDDDTIAHWMFIPVHVGYQHSYDSGFKLGVSLEMWVAFDTVKTYYMSTTYSDGGSELSNVIPYVGMVTAGCHIGF